MLPQGRRAAWQDRARSFDLAEPASTYPEVLDTVNRPRASAGPQHSRIKISNPSANQRQSVDDKLLLVEAAEAAAEDCELVADVRSWVPRLGGGPRL